MKNLLLAGFAVLIVAVAGVAVFLAVTGRRQLRAETQRRQVLEERLGNYDKRLAQTEADLAKARGEFTADLGRVRDTLARHREVLRRLVGQEFLADFTNCYWRGDSGIDFDFGPVIVRTGKTTTAVSSNGTRYSLTLSADDAILTVIQENQGSARRSSYVRRSADPRIYVGTYTWNGTPRVGAEGYVLLEPTADDPLAPPPAPAGRVQPSADQSLAPPPSPTVQPPLSAEEHYKQEEANLRKLGKWGSERLLRDRVKGGETATSQERWETYRLLQFFHDSLAENNPQRSEAKRGMSDMLYLEGKPTEAKSMFEDALDLLDGRKDKLTAPCETEMRVITFFQRNDPTAAMEYLDLLLTRYPDSDAAARCLLLVGRQYENKGQLEQALTYYRELKARFAAPKWDPSYERKAWFAESVVLSNLQRQEESVQVLDALAERLKTSEPDWAARALQQSALTVAPADPADALARCQKALALVPADSALAREVQDYMRRMKAKLPKELAKTAP